MEKLREYQKLQSNPKKPKEVKEMPAWMQKIVNMYQVPNTDVILKRAAFYAVLALWSVLKPGVGGPTFQVTMSIVINFHCFRYHLSETVFFSMLISHVIEQLFTGLRSRCSCHSWGVFTFSMTESRNCPGLSSLGKFLELVFSFCHFRIVHSLVFFKYSSLENVVFSFSHPTFCKRHLLVLLSRLPEKHQASSSSYI